ncbi:MAG: TonB-dependent receptor [Candidatus Omnitrophota bacterium]
MKRSLFLLWCLFLLAMETGLAQDVDLNRIVVTSSRMARMDYQIASNVTVIRSQQIERSGAATVSGILKERLGLNIYDQSSAKTATIDIRGFNDAAKMNVLVLMNGRKINSIDLSGADLLQVPLGAVERIEVVHGAGSVLYGDNAVGGIVNIITKKGRGPMSAEAGSYYGSYDRRGSDLELSGSSEEWNYYHYLKYFDEKGYRENSDVLGKDYDGRIGYELSRRTNIDVFTSWHEDDYGLPGGLNETELETLGRRGSADDQDFANTKDRHVHLRLDTVPWPEDIQLGHLVFDAGFRNRDTYAEFAAWNFGTRRNIDTCNWNVKYTFDQEVLGHDFSIVTGLDYYDVENDILGSGSNTDDLTIGKVETGAYVFSEVEAFRHFFVNAGTRYQRADYTFDQRSGTPSFLKQRADENVSMLGVKYEYGRGSSVFAGIQQTFRFLATDEWYDTWSGLDTTLSPQTGIQYEAGIKHNLSEAVMLGVTPYWIEIEDEIFFDPQNTFFGKTGNYDKTRRIGVETEARADMGKLFSLQSDFLTRWETFVSYTRQEPEFVDGPYDEKRVPFVPNNQAAAGVNVQLLGAYNLSVSGRYVGSMFAINDTLNATGKIEPYTVFDMNLAYEKMNYKVYFQLNNIFNEEYFSYVAKSTTSPTKDHFPAPGRNFYVGMKVRF